MSDYSISIVPKKSSYPNNKRKGEEILDWLLIRDIVKPTLSDCILSSSYGYSISDGARKVTVFPDDLPFGLMVSGLEIVTNRRVFDTGDNFIDELICPNCRENIAFSEWDLNPWYSVISDNLTCPQCKYETEIHNFSFEPDWGFSDLGFKFWNWPDFTDRFIEEFKQELGCEISIVHQHI